MTDSDTDSYIDELPEDPVIPNQKYVVLSYAFSKHLDRNGHRLPMIKIRGSYPDLQGCDKRIKRLDDVSEDIKTIPLMKTEVGKWIGLYDPEELYKNNDIDIEYKEDFMNQAMRGLREAQEKSDVQFFNRVKKDVEKTKKSGTKEGQEELAEQKEHPISVFSRFKTFEHTVEVLTKKLEEATNNMKKAEEDMAQFTEEEIENAKKEVMEANLVELKKEKKIRKQLEEETLEVQESNVDIQQESSIEEVPSLSEQLLEKSQ